MCVFVCVCVCVCVCVINSVETYSLISTCIWQHCIKSYYILIFACEGGVTFSCNYNSKRKKKEGERIFLVFD